MQRAYKNYNAIDKFIVRNNLRGVITANKILDYFIIEPQDPNTEVTLVNLGLLDIDDGSISDKTLAQLIADEKDYIQSLRNNVKITGSKSQHKALARKLRQFNVDHQASNIAQFLLATWYTIDRRAQSTIAVQLGACREGGFKRLMQALRDKGVLSFDINTWECEPSLPFAQLLLKHDKEFKLATRNRTDYRVQKYQESRQDFLNLIQSCLRLNKDLNPIFLSEKILSTLELNNFKPGMRSEDNEV